MHKTSNPIMKGAIFAQLLSICFICLMVLIWISSPVMAGAVDKADCSIAEN